MNQLFGIYSRGSYRSTTSCGSLIRHSSQIGKRYPGFSLFSFSNQVNKVRFYSQNKRRNIDKNLFNPLDIKSVSQKNRTERSDGILGSLNKESPIEKKKRLQQQSQKRAPKSIDSKSNVSAPISEATKPKFKSKRILDTEWYIVTDENNKNYFFNRETNEMLEKPPAFIIDLLKVNANKKGARSEKSASKYEGKSKNITPSKTSITLEDLHTIQPKHNLHHEQEINGSQMDAIEKRCYWFLQRCRYAKVLEFTDSLFSHLQGKYDQDPLNLDVRELYSLFKLLNVRSLALLGQNKVEQAIPLIAQMLEIGPNRSESICNRGLVYKSENRFDQALKDLEHALKLNPDHIYVYIYLSDIYVSKNDPPKAFEYIKQGLERFPMNYELLISQAKLLTMAQVFDEAIEVAEYCIQIDPKVVDAYLVFADVSMTKGQFEEAALGFNHAIQVDSTCAFAYVGLGHALQNIKKFEEAVLAYRVGLQYEPNSLEALEGIIVSFFKSDMYDDCSEYADKLLLLDGKNIIGLYFKAICLQRRFKFHQSNAILEEVLEIEPENLAAIENLALGYRSVREFDKGLQLCDNYLNKYPYTHTIIYIKGLLYQSQNNLEKALEEYERLIDLAPENMDAKIAKTSIFFAKREFKNGLEYYATYKHLPNTPPIMEAMKMAMLGQEEDYMNLSKEESQVDHTEAMKVAIEMKFEKDPTKVNKMTNEISNPNFRKVVKKYMDTMKYLDNEVQDRLSSVGFTKDSILSMVNQISNLDDESVLQLSNTPQFDEILSQGQDLKNSLKDMSTLEDLMKNMSQTNKQE